MADNGKSSSNDLNMLLKARVIKIRVELDYKKSKLPTQIDTISKFLEKNPVKLGVKLNYKIGDLNTQIKTLGTTLSNSKSFKPIKLAVEIDIKGSAIAIKKQLNEVNKAVADFNKTYGKEIREMQKLQKKASDVAKQAGTDNVKPSTAKVTNFNNIKDYARQLSEAERILKSKIPASEKALFSSVQMKDAQGNLKGFIATLERLNGVTEKVRYSWDKSKGAFQVVDRSTMTATEKMVYKSMQQLQNLEKELDKTGKKTKQFQKEYAQLMANGAKGNINNDIVKQFETRVKNAQAEAKANQKTNELARERVKIERELAQVRKNTKDVGIKSEATNLINTTRSTKDAEVLKDVRLAMDKLKQSSKELKDEQKQYEAIAKRVTSAMRELSKIEKQTFETTGHLSRSNIEMVQGLARRINPTKNLAKANKDLHTIEKELALMRKQKVAVDDLKARQQAFEKLKKVMHDYAKMDNSLFSNKSGNTLDAKMKQYEKQFKNIEQINREAFKWQKKMNDLNNKATQESLNRKANSVVAPATVGKTDYNAKGLKNLIDQGDINEITQYLAKWQKLDIVLARIKMKDGKPIGITAQLASTGKVAKTLDFELDRVNNKLHAMGSSTVFNRNANLGVFEQLRIAMARVPVWMASMTAFYGSIHAVQKVMGEILEIDKVMTQIRRVASDTINLDTVFEGSVEISQRLGNNLKDILGAVSELSRTYGDFNERQLLAVANTAVLMSNVSDLTAQRAIEVLIGTMNAFNIKAEESERIVDSLNEVDNDYAISTQQLAEGLEKSASTSKTFGVTLEENAGHITAIGSVTMESGRIIGNSLKTIYSRITTMDGAKSVLEGVGVSLHNIGANGEKSIRPVNDILSDLGTRWYELTDEQRQNIGVTVAGRYQLSRFLAMMNNWETATNATRTALSAEGSAMRENAKYMQSFEARINKLKNAFSELSLSLGKAFLSDAMYLAIEGLASLAQMGATLASSFGAMPVVLGALGLFIARTKLMKGAVQGVHGVMYGMTTGFKDASRSATGFNRVTQGVRGSLTGMATFLPSLTNKTKMFTNALRGIGTSLAIGAVFVGIGMLIEKMTSAHTKAKQIAEEAEKQNNTLIDSYRNTEGGLHNLIIQQQQLQDAVDNDEIKEGTDAYNDYVEVTNKLAQSMPNIVKYTDQSGLAHLKEATAIDKAYQSAKKLSELKAEEQALKYTENLEKQTKNYDKQIKNLDKVEKKYKDLTKEFEEYEKNLANLSANTPGYKNLDKEMLEEEKNEVMKEQLKLDAEAVRYEAEKHNVIQKTLKLTQDTTLAHLEQNKKLSTMTDTGKVFLENMVQANEGLIATGLEGGDMLEERANEMLEFSTEIADIIADEYANIGKNAGDDPLKLAELQGDLDMVLGSMPKEFFKVEAFENVDDFKDSLDDVFGIVDKIKGGSGDWDGMVDELVSKGFAEPQAQKYIAKMAMEYDNAKIKRKALSQAESEGVDNLNAYVDVALEAINVTSKLWGFEDEDLTSLMSHIEYLEDLNILYGDGAKLRDDYKDSLEQISNFTGLPEDVIEKDLNYYRNVVEIMQKGFEWERDANGKATGYNRDNYNKEQQKILDKTLANQKKYEVHIDLVTGKWTRLKDGMQVVLDKKGKLVEVQKDINKEVDKTNEKEKEGSESANKQKEKIDNTKKSVVELRKERDLLKQTTLFNEHDESAKQQAKAVKEVDDHVTSVREKAYENKMLTMFNEEDTSISGTENKLEGVKGALNTIQDKIKFNKELNLFKQEDPTVGGTQAEINKVNNELDSHIRKKQENHGLGMFRAEEDASATKAKGEVEGVTKSLKELQKERDLFKQKGLFEQEEEAVSAQSKAQEDKLKKLTDAIAKAKDSAGILVELETLTGNVAGKLGELGTNLKASVDGVKDVTGKVEAVAGIKGKIEVLIGALIVANDKFGTMFTGLSGALDRANDLYLTVGGMSFNSSNVYLYGDSLVSLTTKFISATSMSMAFIQTQQQISGAFNSLISKSNEYNQTIYANNGAVSQSYLDMAQTVMSTSGAMTTTLANNARIIQSLTNIIADAFDDVIFETEIAKILLVDKMKDTAKEMKSAFKSGMDSIVTEAGRLPERIYDAINRNSHLTSDIMEKVAKNMVSKFKQELGIHSPSKVFENLGMWTIKGLANGLTGGDLVSLGKDVFTEFGGEAMSSIDNIKSYMQFGAGDVGIGASFGDYRQTSGFGMRIHPITGQAKLHKGVDFAGANNSPIQAKAGGKVTASGWNSGGYGNYVKIQNGAYTYLYAHLNKAIPPVGSTVKKGQLIGLMGSTGDSTGTHLHYEIHKNGRPINPRGYAKGGLIDKHQLAEIGEENKLEMIIPLEQHRNRAMGLWSDAGEYLGFDSKLIDELMKNKKVSGGTGSIHSGGSFSMASGEGGSGSSEGGGGTGSSGVMQESAYTGMRTYDGGYEMFSLEKATTDPFKYSVTDRNLASIGSNISVLEAKLAGVNEQTTKYRDSLREILKLEVKQQNANKSYLKRTETRNKTIQKELKKLPALNKQSEKQRQKYNSLMEEYDSNIGKIQDLKSTIETATVSMKEKQLEIFTDYINELIGKYDNAVTAINNKIDDIDFKIEVSTLLNPDDKKALLNNQVSKATELKNKQAKGKAKVDDLTSQYNQTVKKKGKNSPEAKLLKEQLDTAKEEYEDYQLELLNAEKEIRDTRASIADEGIDTLKDYYSSVKDMALEAIDIEQKRLQEAHDDKMEMYDEEIEKINSVYDEKLKQMDKEKSEDNYQSELDNYTKQKSDLQKRINELKRDTSISGKKKLAEAEAEMTTLSKEISDFQADRQDELLRQGMEEQKNAQLEAIEAKKEEETTKFDEKNEGFEKQKETVTKQYDDLINNDKYWADMRNKAIKGSFDLLNTELTTMKKNLDNMNKGVYDGILKGITGLSAETKKALALSNELEVDNLIHNSASPISDVKEAKDSKKYTMTDGKVTTAKKETSTGATKEIDKNTNAGKTPAPPKPKPAPKKPATKAPAKKPATKAPAKAPASSGNRKITSAVSFRKSPAYGNNIISTIPKNAKVEYVGMEKGWAKIKYNKKTGYVGSSFLKKFDTGGYTGKNVPKGGALAILHNKENVLNEKQTKHIFDTAKIVDTFKDSLLNFNPRSVSDKMASVNSITNNTTIGDIYISVEGGNGKQAKGMADEVIKKLGFKGLKPKLK